LYNKAIKIEEHENSTKGNKGGDPKEYVSRKAEGKKYGYY